MSLAVGSTTTIAIVIVGVGTIVAIGVVAIGVVAIVATIIVVWIAWSRCTIACVVNISQ